MPNTEINKIAIIGTGNVAVNLSLALKDAGLDIIQVFGRNKIFAKELANKLNSSFTTDFKKITTDADLIILSILDSALSDVVNQINVENSLIVHTSGTTSIDVLKNASINYGVFYPLQTFIKQKRISFDNIPVCVEANNIENLKRIKQLAEKISKDVREINSDERKIIHLSAVIACNFSNYMYLVAEDVLKKHGIPFDILKPLIIETSEKIKEHNPRQVQTGPAYRKDMGVIKEHLEMLSNFPDYKEVYKLISENLLKLNIL